MKKFMLFFAITFVLLSAAFAWADFKNGLWEITTQMSIQGMNHQMPPITVQQCLTEKDPVIKNQDKNYSCQTTKVSTKGNTVTYKMECTGEKGTMITEGKTTYTGRTMQGSATTSFKMNGQPAMVMKSKMQGKYIGACK